MGATRVGAVNANEPSESKAGITLYEPWSFESRAQFGARDAAVIARELPHGMGAKERRPSWWRIVLHPNATTHALTDEEERPVG